MRKIHQKNRIGTGIYRKGQEKIVHILEAAGDILIDHGYADLTMRKIANAAGVTPNLEKAYHTIKISVTEPLDRHALCFSDQQL